VDLVIAKALRGRNIDVLTALEAGRCGDTDEQHLEFAAREARVLVTHDQDFLVLHANGTPHAGIVYARNGTRTTSQMVQFLKLVHDVLSPDEMSGRVEFA